MTQCGPERPTSWRCHLDWMYSCHRTEYCALELGANGVEKAVEDDLETTTAVREAEEEEAGAGSRA